MRPPGLGSALETEAVRNDGRKKKKLRWLETEIVAARVVEEGMRVDGGIWSLAPCICFCADIYLLAWTSQCMYSMRYWNFKYVFIRNKVTLLYTEME